MRMIKHAHISTLFPRLSFKKNLLLRSRQVERAIHAPLTAKFLVLRLEVTGLQLDHTLSRLTPSSTSVVPAQYLHA